MEVKDIRTIVSSLDDFINVPDGVVRLRKTVLDLAIRGFLTEAKTKEEPVVVEAEALLDESEEPFIIPDRWTWCKFGGVCETQGGSQPPKSKFIYEMSNGYVRFLQIRDFGLKGKATYIPIDKKNKICEKDDILIGRYGASVGKILTGQAGAYNVALMKVSPNLKILEKEYLKLFLESEFMQQWFCSLTRAAQAGFNRNDLYPRPIPLPPPLEQKRIVERVDELMKLIDQLEVEKKERDEVRGKMAVSAFYSFGTEHNEFALEHLSELVKTPSDIDELEKSILSLAVSGKLTEQDESDGDGEDLYKKIQAKKAETGNKNTKTLSPITEDDAISNFPRSWKVVRLGQVCDFNYGKGLAKKDRKEDGKYGAYGANGIKTRTDLQNSNGPGIVIGRKGSAGAITLVEDSFYATDVTYFVPENQFGAFEMRYLFLLLKSLDLPKYAMGIKPGLNRNHAYKEICGLPPLKEQKRIVAKVNDLMALTQKLREVVEGNS